MLEVISAILLSIFAVVTMAMAIGRGKYYDSKNVEEFHKIMKELDKKWKKTHDVTFVYDNTNYKNLPHPPRNSYHLTDNDAELSSVHDEIEKRNNGKKKSDLRDGKYQ